MSLEIGEMAYFNREATEACMGNMTGEWAVARGTVDVQHVKRGEVSLGLLILWMPRRRGAQG